MALDAPYVVKGSPENIGQINCKIGVEFLGNSIENSEKSIENISNFMWVYVL